MFDRAVATCTKMSSDKVIDEPIQDIVWTYGDACVCVCVIALLSFIHSFFLLFFDVFNCFLCLIFLSSAIKRNIINGNSELAYKRDLFLRFRHKIPKLNSTKTIGMDKKVSKKCLVFLL